MINKHCSHCGAEHTQTEYPLKCPACKQLTWVNPLPVAVLLQTVGGHDEQGNARRGILIGRRAIAPHIGEWGLIGGYMECADESIIDAAVREFREETNIDLDMSVYRNDIQMVSSFCDGRALLIFSVSDLPISEDRLADFTPNTETSELKVAWEPEQLCFSSHTAALADWFKTNAA